MSTTSLLLKAFNKQFFEFIDDIISIFPENAHLITSREYFETIKSANPTLLIKIWEYFILTPYQDEINKGNLDFFLKKDYTVDLAQMPNSEEIVKVIDSTLREPLQNMDAENREKCMKHFQLVTKICAKYFDEKK